MLHTRITPPTLFLENKLMGGWQRGGEISLFIFCFPRVEQKKSAKKIPSLPWDDEHFRRIYVISKRFPLLLST
ncbi:hypothetical protein ACWCKO_32565, partial [Bacillus thuringiensis serovar darmstadiensis]